jgi:hypothetical protein
MFGVERSAVPHFSISAFQHFSFLSVGCSPISAFQLFSVSAFFSVPG